MKKSKGFSNLNSVQRFSIRKFSVGIASVVIGSFFVSTLTAPSVHAQTGSPAVVSQPVPTQVTTRYQYVSTEELSWEQRQAIQAGTPSQIAAADQVYYFVYRPAPGTRQLPVTGEASALMGLAAGASLLVFAVGLVRDKKKALTSLIVVTTLGQVLMTPSMQAFEARLLSQFNQTLETAKGDVLPEPRIQIEGYDYIGYLTEADMMPAQPGDGTSSASSNLPSSEVTSTSSESTAESSATSLSSSQSSDSSAEPAANESSASQSSQSSEVSSTSATSESASSAESSSEGASSESQASSSSQPASESSSAAVSASDQASTPNESSIAPAPIPTPNESSSDIAPQPTPNESSSDVTPQPTPNESSSDTAPTSQPDESSATVTPDPTPTPEPPKVLDFQALEAALSQAQGQAATLATTATQGKTPSSVAQFQAQVAAIQATLAELTNQAQALKAAPATTEQAQIDALLAQVQRAAAPLATLPAQLVDQADKTPLETALAALVAQVQAAQGQALADKTPGSQQALQNAIRTAQAALQNARSVVADPEATAADVAAMTQNVQAQKQALEDAIKALQPKADTRALVAALAQLAAPIDTETKTPHSIEAFQAALSQANPAIEAARTQAQAILANPDASQAEVEAALAQVQAAQALVDQAKQGLTERADKTVLERAKERLDQASNKDVATANKRPKTVQAYRAAKETALQVSQEAAHVLADLNTTPAAVLAATEKLNQAFEQLQLTEAGILDVVNKADLERALAQLALPVDTTDKTPRSIAAYEQVLATHQSTMAEAQATAQALIQNQDATPEEVATALAALQQAQGHKDQAVGLLEDSAQKAALRAQISEAQAAVADKYTPTSWAPLAQQLQAAQATLEDGNASQTDVDHAVQALKAALEQLEEVEPQYLAAMVEAPESDLSRTVTVGYQLQDPNNRYQGGKVQVYQGDTLVKTVPIENLTATIEGLDYHVPYRLHTIMDYTTKAGAQSKDQLEDQTVELSLKKIELKQIKGVQLFRGQGSGAQRVAALTQVPDQLQDYYVKVQSDRFKDVYLPVTQIEEIQHDGQSYFRVTAQAPELVQNQGGASDYHTGYQFLIDQDRPAEGNVHYTFKSLIEAMRQDPSGHYIVGAYLDASGFQLAADASAYLLDTFTGTLSGQTADGVQHAIYNLAVPLFNQLNGATIQHIDLKQVNVKGNNGVAALAKKALKSVIQDVAVAGQVTGTANVAGVIHHVADGSRLENVRFQGQVTQTGLPNNGQDIGGLVGLVDNSSVTNAYVDVDLAVQLNVQSARAGGAFGRVVANRGKARVANLLVNGTLVNTGRTVKDREGGQVGGVVGSTWQNGRLENVISNLTVTNGYRGYGDRGAISAGHIRNDQVNWKFTDKVSGIQEPNFNPSQANQADVDALASQVATSGGVLTDTPDQPYVAASNHQVTDYSRLAHYQADRAQAYANMEKLLPFYNKEQIIKYGNLVDSTSKLATQVLLAVTPMQGDAFVTDYDQDMDRIMLHFADKSVQYLGLANKTRFKDTGIVEYQLEDSGLIYTPNQVLTSVDDVMNAILDVMKGTSLSSEEIWRAAGVYDLFTDAQISDKVKNDRRKALETKLGRTATAEEITQDLDDYRYEQRAWQISILFFDATFQAFQDTLANDLVKILRQDGNYLGTHSQARADLIQKIKDNRGALLLGLAYLQDHYRINFGDKNVGEIATYQTDFFGNQASLIDKLIHIGSLGGTSLQSNNSAKVYASTLSADSRQATIVDYLDYFRTLWTDMDQYDWFKDATKANVTIEERPSLEPGLSEQPYKVYDRLKVKDYQDYILPLLNLKKSHIFLVSNVLSLTLGSTDRRPNLSSEEFENRVKLLADRQQIHVDTWYRVALPAVKQRMARGNAMLVWDGYANGKNGGWYDGLGNDVSNKPVKYPSMAIKEFFGRIRRVYKPNGSGAYADTQNGIYFVSTDILSGYLGMSHWTHEVVHNMDKSVYLGGNGWRPGESFEEYPQGLLQSVEGPGWEHIGFNTSYDFSHEPNRMYNATPDRFQSADDWGEYTHRLFDILYLLDYTEAKAVMDKGPDAMKQWYNRFINVADGPNHVNNKVVAITDEEWNQFNIQSIDDFVTHSLAPKRYFRAGLTTDRNSYERVPMFHPMYGTGQNDKGSPGGWWFKRMAWELMAYKGYEHGFIPYASNQLERQAKADGTVLNDNYIIQKISNGEFQDLNSFKKAMFKERLDKLANGATFRPITVKGRQVTTLDDLQALMNEAVDQVLTNRKVTTAKNEVFNLKAEIYRQFFKNSDDFRQSIFANE